MDLCPSCYSALPWNRTACLRCATPLSGSQGLVCGYCLRKPPAFDASLTPLRYQAPVDWLIQAFKFNQRLPQGRLLGQLLARYLAGQVDELPELIVPVPLHSQRLRERGYNQALELARPLARQLGLVCAPDLVRRTRATAIQSLLAARQRRQNVRGAFELLRPLSARHVAIVDDVIATGSTVGELARVLRRGGAERIEVWAVAHAIGN